MSKVSMASAAILLALVAISFAKANVDFKNPVRSAELDEVKGLPGLKVALNFKQYSGYLNADAKNNRFWHYWFVESQSDPENDPLVLWLNGGPGCSSLLGLLTELGPFRIGDDNSLVENPYAWNKNANVLFIESPAGVGYSYAADGDIKADDDTTAEQNHQALRSFLDKFPKYRKSPLYLTGESYGGVYLPTLAVLVDKDPEMNLKGVAIGNGYLDANKLAESLIYFFYYHGLFGRSTWKKLSTSCCDGKPPARGDCHFTDPNRSAECDNLMRGITNDILESGLNPYNLYDRCAGQSQQESLSYEILEPGYRRRLGREDFDKNLMLGAMSSPLKPLGREHFDKNLVYHALNITRRHKGGAKLTFSKLGKPLGSLGGDPPCTDDSIVINYLNSQAVRAALHIPDDLKTQFTTCFDGIQYTMIYPSRQGGLAPQMRSLIASERELNLLVYNGDIDLMCNFFGDEWFVDDLNRPLLKDYRLWRTNGQVSGFVKDFEGITYMTVKGSGHMVPTDRPAEALNMIQKFLSGERFD